MALWAGAPPARVPWGCPGSVLVTPLVPSAGAAARRHRRGGREQQGEGNEPVVAGDVFPNLEPTGGLAQPCRAGVPRGLPAAVGASLQPGRWR